MLTLSPVPGTPFVCRQRSDRSVGVPAISGSGSRANIRTVRSSFRFPSATRFQLKLKRRVPTAFSSEANSLNGETIKPKTDSSATGASDGPPLLTILAGVVVLLLACCVIGSIIMWLVGLIVNVPPS